MDAQHTTTATHSDIILIGAGVMSATLGTMLKELSPQSSIRIFETLSGPAEESSNEWNNAGTGHAALCELNYTPENPDGSVEINRAVAINEKFKLSLQFWSYLVNQGKISAPEEFITQLPHISFVQGEKDVQFLRNRYAALADHPLFYNMEYSEAPEVLAQWMPLMMQQRDTTQPIAATKIDTGTDINFGALTRKLIAHLNQQENVSTHYNHCVKDIKRNAQNHWQLDILDKATGQHYHYTAKFVFIGGGGGSLKLLHKTGIPESQHIGGVPVSGLFMVCQNPEVVSQHFAKVYGRAALGAPPMSVPHLDTRFIEGKQTLLFGPFAGFTSKFLKHGSVWDLPASVHADNLTTVIAAGSKNLDLTKYLIQQVLLNKEERMKELRQFVPNAKSEDWHLLEAGQRVQIIKDTPKEKGVLRFGTEVVHASDGSIAALLGASPGASISVQAMLEVIEQCFPEKLAEWDEKLHEMIPSLGKKLADHPDLINHIQTEVRDSLGLKPKS
ncbi:malate dehydrogenase (quinone) [Neisseriaceae bacterium B1]